MYLCIVSYLSRVIIIIIYPYDGCQYSIVLIVFFPKTLSGRPGGYPDDNFRKKRKKKVLLFLLEWHGNCDNYMYIMYNTYFVYIFLQI